MQVGELERRSRHLEALDDASFLRELGAWLAFADQEPASGRVLAELRGQYLGMLYDHQRHDEDTLLGLLDVREQLAALAGMELEPRLPAPAAEGTSRAHALIEVLRRELRQLRMAATAEGDRARFVVLTGCFDALAARHTRRHRDFIALLHTSACGSLRRLDWLADEVVHRRLSRYPVENSAGDPDGALGTALASVRPLLDAALSEQPDLTPSEQRQLGHIAEGARIDAARVQDRVRRRTRAAVVARHHYERSNLGAVMHRARGCCL